MNRKEFIGKLRSELSKMPAEEVDAAIEYYEEYFDEAGPENEQDVIKELGNPKKVAGQIKSEYAVKMLDAEKRPTARKGLSAVWWIIIGICSAPISIPLAICLVCIAVSIFAVAICCIVGIFAAILGCGAGAVFLLVMGIMAIPASFSTALLAIGVGLIGLGVLAALSVAIVIGIRAAITSMVRAMRRRNERKRIEKMRAVNDSNKWRYGEEAPTVKDAWKTDTQQDSWKYQQEASESEASNKPSEEFSGETEKKEGVE